MPTLDEDEDPDASVLDPYLDQLRHRADGRSLRRLLPLVKDAVRLAIRAGGRELPILVISQILTAAIAAGQVLIARSVLSDLLRANAAGTSVSHALPGFALLAVLTGVSGAGTAVQSQRIQVVGELVSRATSAQILDITTRVPLDTFDRPSFYDRLQRVQANALTQPTQVVQGLLSLVGGLVGSIGVTIALLVVQPVLVPILLSAAIPLFLLQRRGSRVEFAFIVAQTPLLRRRFALAELLTSRPAAKEIRAFGIAGNLRQRYDSLYDGYVGALRAKVRTRLRIQVLSEVITAVVGLTAIGVLLSLVSHHDVSLSAAAAAVAGIGLLGSKLAQLSAGAGTILQSGLFLADLDDFMARSETLPAIASRAALQPAATGFTELAAAGVGYTYVGAAAPALTDIDLTIRRGSVVALVGENGSGKTTLSKLLANLYSPTVGALRWDGVDVSSLDVDACRSQTAILFQDFLHYELSLYDNVALGRVSRFDDAAGVAAALARGGGDAVVASLPAGWDTFLSPRFPDGRDLSLGQWQRVAMARALFRDAPFIVLDEPTAALDPRAEAALFDTVQTLLAGRTVVLVTHRLASVRHADEILVMHEGRIVQRGTHASLMAAGGRYRELFELQAAAYAAEPGASAD